MEYIHMGGRSFYGARPYFYEAQYLVDCPWVMAVSVTSQEIGDQRVRVPFSRAVALNH